ncbi:MAG: cytochrome P450 [Candidatus Acidiferrales bacterium]
MALLEVLKNTVARFVGEGETEIKELTTGILNEVEHDLAAADAHVMAFLEQLKTQAVHDPRPIFTLLRMIKPILLVKNYAVVTRFDDVQEVLSRDDIFQVTYGPKMKITTGGNNFFLGMQNSPAYERDVSHMRSAIRREDVPSIIAPFVQETARRRLVNSNGQVDVVPQLGRFVPTRLVAEYFGCPPASDSDLAAWATAIFTYLFADVNNDPAVGQAAGDAAAKTRAFLDQAIAARKAHPISKDDVLGRCLDMQKIGLPGMDDLGIRNNLLGLIVGAIPTTSTCCAQALDQLLSRPQELAGAQAAALAGDDTLLAKYVFEALRFNPNNPGLFRITGEDYPLAKGQIHGVTIPKGTQVFAATLSAMFDGTKVDHPDDFRTDRPPYVYMHFGYGLHSCFGRYINQVQIPGILKPLLACKKLRRAPGDAGALQYAGPFPSSLKVNFDAAAAGAGRT